MNFIEKIRNFFNRPLTFDFLEDCEELDSYCCDCKKRGEAFNENLRGCCESECCKKS